MTPARLNDCVSYVIALYITNIDSFDRNKAFSTIAYVLEIRKLAKFKIYFLHSIFIEHRPII